MMNIIWCDSFHNERYDARASTADPTFGTVHFKVIDRDDGGQPVVIGTVRRDGCANADMFTPNDGVQLHWCDLQQYAAFSEALGWAVKTAMETAAKGPHLV